MTTATPAAVATGATHPPDAPLRLLIVDDDESDRLSVRRCLRQSGIAATVDEAASGADALERVAATAYDCVLLDYYLPGIEGLALLTSLRQAALGSPPVVIFTGRGDEEVAVELMKAGAADYLPKASLTAERLAASLRHTLELARAEAAIRSSQQRERFIANVSQVLGAYLDQSEALHALSELVVPALADFCFLDEFTPSGRIERVAWKHVDAARTAWFADILGSLFPPTAGDHPAARVLRAGAPEFTPQVTDAWMQQAAVSPGHLRFLRELDVRSLLRVPITVGNDVLGVLTLGYSDSDRRYTDTDLALAAAIADRAAATLHNSRLYAQLQQAVRSRDEVASVVSHDLKNPVHTIQMAASLLLDPDIALDPAQRQKQVEVIRRSAIQMSRLLEDLLDISNAEGGRLALEARPEEIGPIVHEAQDAFQLRATELGLELRAEVAPELPSVLVDRPRVLQVLSNLIANSLKFTPPGGTVIVRAEPAGSELRLSVLDTGIGIARADLEYVFDRFWQVRRAERASAGLGLAIAKSVVEAHGGRIWVESTEGHGTLFCFTLPLAREP